MNLWLRFLRVVMAAFLSRQRLAPEAVSALTMRVWPTDLDLNFHMNNGRYLTLMDLGRIDLLMRAGLARAILARRWMPVLADAQIRYRCSLGPFRRFRLETRITGWNEHSVFIAQRFVIASGPEAGVLAAQASVRAVVLDRGRKVPVAEIFALSGIEPAAMDGAGFDPAPWAANSPS
ncbi:acyl-CoA thioesterase [Pseudoxanthobacter sp.]|uniref:acyl-CoA thioesterase n=1 Tax=Pseudoxanthobacter sp. TaxID=1925742 RepID=UPI002FE2E91A